MSSVARKRDDSLDDVPLTLLRVPIINENTKIFAMGSCFAMEVQRFLRRKNFNILPAYLNVEEQLKPVFQKASKISYIPLDERLIWYNTYTIKQEFEKATGDYAQDFNDFWTRKEAPNFVQDPYRRHLIAESSAD